MIKVVHKPWKARFLYCTHILSTWSYCKNIDTKSLSNISLIICDLITYKSKIISALLRNETTIQYLRISKKTLQTTCQNTCLRCCNFGYIGPAMHLRCTWKAGLNPSRFVIICFSVPLKQVKYAPKASCFYSGSSATLYRRARL